MATGGNENASDEIITVKCCVCEKKNITKEAEKYCIQCQDYYCIPCTDMHTMFPAMSGHQILDKSDFRSLGLQTGTLPCVPTERCSIHKTKLLDMYCGNHDEVVCATCVALGHKTCNDMHSIPEEIDGLYTQSALNDTLGKLNAAKINMEDIKKTLERLYSELKQDKDAVIDAIRKFRQEIETVIDRLERESVKMVESQYKGIASELQNRIKETEQYTNALGQSVDKLVKPVGNKAQEFVFVKTAEKNICKALKAESHLNKTQKAELCFFADETIQNFIQNLSTFGVITANMQKEKEEKSKVYVVKAKKTIDIKLKKDKESCVIFGSCFTTNGDLLLTDSPNKRLKRVGASMRCLKDHVDLESGPLAVCQISRDEVAVTMSNKKIQFISLGTKMVATTQTQVDHTCYGLAFKDGKMFVSDSGGTVFIHDRTGNTIRKVNLDPSGNRLFYSNRHIVCSSNGDRVFVADNNKGLVILDTQGNYEATFTDPDLSSSQDVSSDGRGNIFVSGVSSKVVQINEKTLTKIGVLTNMTYCHSASFNPKMNILALTQSGDYVLIYELA